MSYQPNQNHARKSLDATQIHLGRSARSCPPKPPPPRAPLGHLGTYRMLERH